MTSLRPRTKAFITCIAAAFFVLSGTETAAQSLNCSRFQIATDKDTGEPYCVGQTSSKSEDDTGAFNRTKKLMADQETRTQRLLIEQERRLRNLQRTGKGVYSRN